MEEAPMDIITLRNINSKATKAFIAAAASYNTAHRLFTNMKDRGRDLKRAALNFARLSDEEAGNIGLSTLAHSVVNYGRDNFNDKMRRVSEFSSDATSAVSSAANTTRRVLGNLTSPFSRRVAPASGGKRRKSLRKRRRA